MKDSKAVAAARQKAEAKKAEVEAAEVHLRQLRAEMGTALLAIEEARDADDAHLPQCRMVKVRWRSNGEEEIGRVAIVRKTPGGQLIVRRRGAEYRFKWNPYGQEYAQAEKDVFFASDRRQLRDVPSEFLPAAKIERSHHAG